ncbi:MAG: CusA/CzcA family heavy metal efflux RND transporter, partial [Saprospiraceae bacterium]|nr:CusA/CzcA family heavy metal efflux RND transporter [Saprospiraceae bacterium]
SRVAERVEQISSTLPEGVVIEPYLVRNELIDRAISTVRTNLLEGGLIVVFILVLLLGSIRAGLIVGSVIPLSMLFALGMMNVFGLSANLMSLGAIDFGLIVDGAVIVVEAIVARLRARRSGETLSRAEMDEEVLRGAVKIRKSAAFGEIIILMVYIPILALSGIEGKMFRPMAMTVGFAITGALILSLTYVPMMSALFLKRHISKKRTISDSIMDFLYRMYRPVLKIALRAKIPVIALVLLLFSLSLWQFNRLGGEFIPTLEEGDFALHQILPPGSSLEQSIEVSGLLQKKLLANFPEVERVVTKIGTAEIPTDPMPIETGDIIVIMKPKEEWVTASNRREMFEKMEEVMNEVPGINYEFSQPIQMRFNELMTGSRGDIALKIFGEDLDILYRKAKETERLINDNIEGILSMKVEQLTGMPQIIIRYDYAKPAQYGLQIKEINRFIRTGFAGEKVGVVYEGERRFDMVVRLQAGSRQDVEDVKALYVPLPAGGQVPLSEVAEVNLEEAPMQISRDDTRRRIVISINGGSKDTETLVNEIGDLLDERLELPPGYYVDFGGQFENLRQARERLSIAVPVALALIFVLLFLTFNSLSQALLIFTAIPLAAIGGIWALWLRDMPFSISAGVGFIALFGVAVLNGIVLISYFNDLKEEGMNSIRQRIMEGTKIRLRPVVMTASVASLGFLPMALSTSGGAEVQRPLATVVIGGLITATFLTLVVLPILYSWLERWKGGSSPGKALALLIALFFCPWYGQGQRSLSLEEALQMAETSYPTLEVADLRIQQREQLEGSGFELLPTRIFYSGNALGDQGQFAEQSFGFRQNNLQLPRVYRLQNQLLEQQTEMARKERALSLRFVQRMVALTYADWEALHEKQAFFNRFESLYSTFLDIAEVRYETGESSRLEQLTARNRLETVRLSARQNREQLASLERQLQLLLSTEEELIPEGDTLRRISPVPSMEQLLAAHPLPDYLQQRKQVAETRVLTRESQLLPDFGLSYAYQIISGLSPFHQVQFSLGIPLFRKAQKKRIEAASIDVEIREAEKEARTTALEQQLIRYYGQLEQVELALQYYESQGGRYADELVRTAELQYENGEIAYLEYVQA